MRPTKRVAPPPVEDELDPVEPDDDGEEEAEPARRPGRPKRAVGPFTSPVALRSPEEDFFVWLQNIAKPDWEFLIAYLWRTDPKDDNTKGGRAKHIRKFTTCFDSDEVKRLEGSGGYRIDFCAIDRNTRVQKRIEQYYWEINDPDFPPRMGYGPWIDYPDNANWIWCKSRLVGVPEDIAAASSGNVGAGGESAASVIRATVAAMNANSQQSNQLSALTARTLDPNYNLEMLKSMKDILGGSGGGETNAIFMLMLDNARKDREEMHREMMELRKEAALLRQAPATQPKTAVELLREQVEVKNLARQLAGSERGVTKDDDSMPGWLRPVIEVLGPPIAAIVAQRFASPPPAGAQQTQTRPGQQQQPTPNAQRPAVQSGAPPAGDSSAAGQENHENMDPRTLKLIKHQRLLQQIFPFLIDHFVNGVGEPEQNSGEAFRDFFLSRHSEPQLRELKEDVPPDFIVEYVGAVPELANALHLNITDGKLDAGGAAELAKFMTDFYTDPPQESVS